MLNSFQTQTHTYLILQLTITKKIDTPCLWETSCTSKIPSCNLIANPQGYKKSAIFINQPKPDMHFTGNNALIPIELQDFVIISTYSNSIYTTKIYTIHEILKHEEQCKLLHHHTISNNPDVSMISYDTYYIKYPHLRSVIRSSKKKAKKNETYDIHYCYYQHLLKNNH